MNPTTKEPQPPTLEADEATNNFDTSLLNAGDEDDDVSADNSRSKVEEGRRVCPSEMKKKSVGDPDMEKRKAADNVVADDNAELLLLGRVKKKAHACSECPAKFYTREGLDAHARVHAGKKPFECPHCNLDISSKSHLQVRDRCLCVKH